MSKTEIESRTARLAAALNSLLKDDFQSKAALYNISQRLGYEPAYKGGTAQCKEDIKALNTFYQQHRGSTNGEE